MYEYKDAGIIGTPNGGYAISNDDEVMTAELIVHHLKQRFPVYGDCFVECFKTIDSTNVHAKRILADCGGLRDSNGALTLHNDIPPKLQEANRNFAPFGFKVVDTQAGQPIAQATGEDALKARFKPEAL